MADPVRVGLSTYTYPSAIGLPGAPVARPLGHDDLVDRGGHEPSAAEIGTDWSGICLDTVKPLGAPEGPESTLEDTIILERRWAQESVAHLQRRLTSRRPGADQPVLSTGSAAR